jgi:signal transduction histidine kinase
MMGQKIVTLSARRSNRDHDHSADETTKRLPQFIVENTEAVVSEWEEFARSLIPASSGMSPLALRDHIREILTFFVCDIQTEQTTAEEVTKSRGNAADEANISAAETHAALRLTGGFNMGQMISEYRALRTSIIKLWRQSGPAMDETDFLDMSRFNESVDQALAESAAYYSKHTLRSKDMFVAVLSHDIRNPLQSIMSSAELLARVGELNERQTMLSSNIIGCVERLNGLADNLLDVTRSRMGASLSLARSNMDMGLVAYEIVEEVRLAHRDATITIDLSPDLRGSWDKARVGQVMANLLSNAIQYGFKGYPIAVAVRGDEEAVTVSVQNQGRLIDPAKMGGIFDPLTRAEAVGDEQMPSCNLGLGLYISHEILVAHGGNITVTSSDTDGTRFEARFPRFVAGAAA